MSWDRIESLIVTVCTVIAAVCSVIAYIKARKKHPIIIKAREKHPIDPTKIFRVTVVLVAVAAGALVTGVFISSIATVSTVIVTVCSLLLLIIITKNPISQESSGKKPDRPLVTVVLVMLVIGIMLLLLNKLPFILAEVVKEEGDIIALMTEAAICKDIQVNNEKIFATLADSQVVCKRVYQEALERTKTGRWAYVDKTDERYFLPENWKEKDEPVLLTARERGIIQDYLDSTTHESKEDLCALIYFVLNDDKMITELAQPGAYNVKYYDVIRLHDNKTPLAAGEQIKMFENIPVVTRETYQRITPFEKIAIIGAYIDEKRHEPSHNETSP